MKRWLWLALALPGVAEAACTAIGGATTWLPDGPRADAVVIVDGTSIAYAGDRPADLGAPANGAVAWRGRSCGWVDGAGKVLTAGLIETTSGLGLVEIDLEEAANDLDAGEADPIRAAFRAADAYDPLSAAVPVARTGGLTSAIIVPRGGIVSGQAGLVRLVGNTQDDTVVAPFVAMHATFAAASRAEAARQLREILDLAQTYARNPGAWRGDQARTDVSHRDLDAMRAVLDGRVPLLVRADRAADIELALRIAAEYDLRLVIEGGAEAWIVADRLAAAGVPVIVDPFVYGAGGFDQIHGRADNAARLAAAGVRVVISTFETHNARTLRIVAGNAVRGGLDRGAALAAITSNAAAAFGLGDRGRVAPGAVADLALWSGDPLEIATRLEGLWIDGAPASLRTRQSALLDKYRTVPGTPLPPLPPTAD